MNVDLVWWDSMEAAERAMENASKSQTCAAYFALMARDQSSAY